MLLLRKIDCYGQMILAGGMMLSCFALFIEGGFLVILFLLGCWQVLSAILNTYSFTQCGFSQRIFLYWTCCLADLLLFLSYWLQLSGNSVTTILFSTSLIMAFVVAGYYLWIYHRLIGFISLRNELDGLTKSRH